MILYNPRDYAAAGASGCFIPRNPRYWAAANTLHGKVSCVARYRDFMILRNARYFANENTLHGKVFYFTGRRLLLWRYAVGADPSIPKYFAILSIPSARYLMTQGIRCPQIPRFAKYIRHLLLQVIDTLQTEVLCHSSSISS